MIYQAKEHSKPLPPQKAYNEIQNNYQPYAQSQRDSFYSHSASQSYYYRDYGYCDPYYDRPRKTDRSKYKTELCKNWIEVGICRYENKCQFAHGEDELIGRLPPSNTKYKSKICTTFQDRLYCPYGKRCLFRHDDRPVEQLDRYFYVTKLALLTQELHQRDELVEEESEQEPKRLPIFQEICEKE